jgi:hypothetical protein
MFKTTKPGNQCKAHFENSFQCQCFHKPNVMQIISAIPNLSQCNTQMYNDYMFYLTNEFTQLKTESKSDSNLGCAHSLVVEHLMQLRRNIREKKSVMYWYLVSPANQHQQHRSK